MVEGEGKGNGNGGNGDKPKEGLKASDLVDALKPITESITGLQGKFETVDIALAGIKEAAEKKVEGDPPDPTTIQKEKDLEGMSRKEFMGVVVDEIIVKIKSDFAEPITKRMDDKQTGDLEKEVADAIKTAEGSHRDFWDWKDEMGKEVKANPYLSPEDAYLLSRVHNPEKAKEQDVKVAKEIEVEQKAKVEADEKARKEGKVKPIFGGLTPTSGKTEPNKKMKTKEAAETAYSEAFGVQSEVE